MTRQCSSCGGFCSKRGCERRVDIQSNPADRVVILEKALRICADQFDAYAAAAKIKCDLAMDSIDTCSFEQEFHRNQQLAFNARIALAATETKEQL